MDQIYIKKNEGENIDTGESLKIIAINFYILTDDVLLHLIRHQLALSFSHS
jgi:hypothetical protein